MRRSAAASSTSSQRIASAASSASAPARSAARRHGGGRGLGRPAGRAADRRAAGAPQPTLFAGIGGPRMEAQGFESHYPMEKLSVRGYAEVLRHYREILAIRRRLAQALLAERPDLFIGVDAPDFNLGLERKLKDAGIPTIHYVSPSVWAWRGWRVRKIARSVDRMLVMFPFEPPLYEKAGMPGHLRRPSARRHDPARAEQARGARRAAPAAGQADRRAAARQPALRAAVHGDAFVLAAHRFRQEVHDVHFVCPTVTRDTRDMFERAHARAAAHRPAAHSALRPLPRGAGRRRPGAGGERHRDAGGGAVQDADGDRLPPVSANMGADARNALPALRRHAEHPRRREAGARAAAGRRHPGRAGRRAADAAARYRARSAARSSASASSTTCCARTPPRRRPMPILEVHAKRNRA